MRMIECFTPQGRTALSLPETGVFDNNGHLFHHAHNHHILPIHFQRLEEHRIYISKKKYSRQENDQLRENWRKFSKEHILTDNDLLSFLNYRKGGKARTITRQSELRKDFIKASFFWPRLCDGFPHRTATAISRQLRALYDPQLCVDGSENPFTPLEDEELIRLYKRGTDMHDIADLMCKTYARVSMRKIILKNKIRYARIERRCLWNVVMEQTGATINDPSELNSLTVVWNKIGQAMFRAPSTLRNEWENIVVDLNKRRDEGLSFAEAFEDAVPPCENISVSDFASFVELFVEEKLNSEYLYCNRHEREKIGKEMKKRGISGFKTGRLSEFKFCLYKMCRILCALRRNVLRPMSICISLHEQLRLLSKCCRTTARNNHSAQRICLSRHVIVKELIEQMREENANWKPSLRIRKHLKKNM